MAEELTYEKCIRLGRSHQVRVEVRAGALHCWPEMASQWAVWGGHFTKTAFDYIDSGMFQAGENFDKHRCVLETFLKLSSPCFYPVVLTEEDQTFVKTLLEPYPNTTRFNW